MNTGCITHGVRPNWMSVDNRDCHWLSQSEIAGGKRIYQQLSRPAVGLGRLLNTIPDRCAFSWIRGFSTFIARVSVRSIAHRNRKGYIAVHSPGPNRNPTLIRRRISHEKATVDWTPGVIVYAGFGDGAKCLRRNLEDQYEQGGISQE